MTQLLNNLLEVDSFDVYDRDDSLNFLRVEMAELIVVVGLQTVDKLL